MSFKKYITQYEPIKFEDSRGHLKVLSEDNQLGVSYKESFSKKGVFRGMHIQSPPYSQVKHIRVLQGSITDYVIILDRRNKDFGKTFSRNIDASESIFIIPHYCAHGFYANEETVLRYICIGHYSEEHEVCIKEHPNNLDELIISNKDKLGKPLIECIEDFSKLKWE